MSVRECNVCGAAQGQPIYLSPSDVSITSLCEVLPRRTEVFFCDECGHLTTPEIGDLHSYYGDQYKILIGSEDEDQLYEQAANGEKTYRADHQLRTLLDKLQLAPGARLLDFGCAKGATYRRLAMLRPDLAMHLFDVSDMYLPFWKRFADPTRWATFVPPSEWAATFDLITSFYALEHVADPRKAAADIAKLLKPGGRAYVIVPDVYQNIGDFVVVDHVNHFSTWSLERLLADAGLDLVEIDASAHQSAIVAIAQKPVGSAARRPPPPPTDLTDRVKQMGSFWADFGERVRRHERSHRERGGVAIYGSGFYGTFISTCLAAPDRVSAFLDQNPYRQGQELRGKPILAPDALPADVNVVYVGLNPGRAREEISKVSAWRGRHLEIFYP